MSAEDDEFNETFEGTTSPEDWISGSLDMHPADHPASFFLGKEFLLWLWWRSEKDYGNVPLSGFDPVEFWIDDRIQFKTDGEDPQISDLKGGAPATTDEARTALRSGKVVETARLGLRIRDREYQLSLKGEGLEISGLKVPGEVKDGLDERILERMFLLEEATAILDALFHVFAGERLAGNWNTETVAAIRSWVAGQAQARV